jgi:hypothetical protein
MHIRTKLSSRAFARRPVLLTLWGMEPFSPAWWLEKEREIVPQGRVAELIDEGFLVPNAPVRVSRSATTRESTILVSDVFHLPSRLGQLSAWTCRAVMLSGAA